MCYECGCGSKTAVMTDGSITEETFKKAAQGVMEMGMAKTMDEALTLTKRNTLKLLEKELGEN